MIEESVGRGGGAGRTALWVRLARQAHPYKRHLAGLLLLSLLAPPLALLLPLPLKIAVDSALGGHPLPRFLESLLPPSAPRAGPDVLWVAVTLLLAVGLKSAPGVRVLDPHRLHQREDAARFPGRALP